MNYKPRQCDFCGTLFEKIGGKQTYCSWECRFMDIVVQFNGTDGCWEWPLGKLPGKRPYGLFDTRRRGRGQHSANLYAHVFSFRLFNGAIPEGLFVLHRCDNPPCINPAHLFVGTQQDNMDDRATKDRGGRKLNREQATAILHSNGKKRDIARQYNVSSALVYAIKQKKTWKHI